MMTWSAIREWWKRRRYEQRWRRATPAMQMVYMVEMLHMQPELRRMFREALFGKTTEAVNPDRRLKAVKKGSR